MINRFPWKYFFTLVRARLLLIIAALLLYFGLINYLRQFENIGTVLILIFICVAAIFHAYLTMKPMRRILVKIDRIFKKLPEKKTTENFYLKDEWEMIEDMLDLTAESLDLQKEAYENQLIQSDTLIESLPTATVIVDKFLNCKQYNKLFRTNFIKDKNIKIINSEKFWKVFENNEIESLFKEVIDQNRSKNIAGFYLQDLNAFFDISVTPLQDREAKLIGALGI